MGHCVQRISRMKSYFVIVILLSLLMGLSGCYEDLNITLHKSHAYKGGLDPHSDDSKTRERKLSRRFELVQTDR